jgi:Domain of unknown function (DUF4470)
VSKLLTNFCEASGDPRNLFQSVLGLPPAYEGKLEMTVNDQEIGIVTRNAIFQLTAIRFEPEDAAVIILHLWYSALIPAEILGQLRESIPPLTQDMCEKIQGRSSLDAVQTVDVRRAVLAPHPITGISSCHILRYQKAYLP